MASSRLTLRRAVLRRRPWPVRDLHRQAGERAASRRRARASPHPTCPRCAPAMARLIASLVGVASMGVIAQAVVGNALHDVVWPTRDHPIRGETRVVTETTPGRTSTRPATTATVTVTVTGETVTRAGAPGQTAPVRPTFVTVPGLSTT